MEKYSPQEIEQPIYQQWEKGNCFNPDKKKEHKEKFSIVIPPPNVTGYLHIGHALVNTLQDIIIRKKRMQGTQTLWLPGTDHAGIATQMVVEKDLLSQGIQRKKIGKDAFVKKVWEWKEKHGNQIYQQLKRLGASLDWSRERFTLDKGLSKAVRKSFVKLYNEGLIYRAEYLVNWCPKDQTALSDLEVDYLDVTGEITQIRYPLIGSNNFIEIATTRPETLLGDTAIAVHPDDQRYKNLIGKQVLVPLVQRKISIIVDNMVDSNFGTGVVKITPAHDPNDFELGKKYQLDFINIFTSDAKLNGIYPPLQGLDRFVARKKVITLLKKQNLWISTKKHSQRLGYSQRSKTVIEPRLSTQWFCKMKTMAKASINQVNNKNIRFYPPSQEKIFREWMNNIQDWCISRQLWWGHPIPAWHCLDCQKITVTDPPRKTCYYCQSKNLQQDPDVLDTWFSSALFPFSTMGWPKKTSDLAKFYPNSLLVTGYDILFFWVARMIMMGIQLTGKVPFPEVILHGLVRDAKGDKMSKTKGNVIDPLKIIEKHGADSLRFALCSLTIDSRDLKLPENAILQAKFFINKLWNATSFVLYHLAKNNITNIEDFQVKICHNIEKQTPYNIEKYTLWILKELDELIVSCDLSLKYYRFFAYANALYNFTWGKFCDWYIEISKPMLFEKFREHEKKSALYGIIKVLENLFQLLHPVCPFVSEYLWQKLPTTKGLLIEQEYSTQTKKYNFNLQTSNFEYETTKAYIQLITQIRTIKGENNLQPKDSISLFLQKKEKNHLTALDLSQITKELPIFQTLAGIEKIEFVDQIEKKEGFALGQLDFKTSNVFVKRDFMIDLSQNLDIEGEQKRLSTGLQKNQKRKYQLEKKLQNPNFRTKAPANLVQANQQEVTDLAQKIAKLQTQLQHLTKN